MDRLNSKPDPWKISVRRISECQSRQNIVASRSSTYQQIIQLFHSWNMHALALCKIDSFTVSFEYWFVTCHYTPVCGCMKTYKVLKIGTYYYCFEWSVMKFSSKLNLLLDWRLLPHHNNAAAGRETCLRFVAVYLCFFPPDFNCFNSVAQTLLLKYSPRK